MKARRSCNDRRTLSACIMTQQIRVELTVSFLCFVPVKDTYHKNKRAPRVTETLSLACARPFTARVHCTAVKPCTISIDPYGMLNILYSIIHFKRYDMKCTPTTTADDATAPALRLYISFSLLELSGVIYSLMLHAVLSAASLSQMASKPRPMLSCMPRKPSHQLLSI